MYIKFDKDKIDAAVKVAALIGASLFFLWKVVTGWLFINLELSLELERRKQKVGADLVAVKLILKKGETGALRLQDISFRIRPVDQEAVPSNPIHFNELDNLGVKSGSNELDWSKVTSTRESSMSPGETLQFARVLEAPPGKPVLVEVAVSGDRKFWFRTYQWRVSAVALPVRDDCSSK